MKKIAIITITDNNNYGNRLQNYAVQQILLKNGAESKTIWNSTESPNVISKLKKFFKRMLPINKYKRRCLFEDFTFEQTNLYFNNFNNELEKYFDYILIGSDQIWNLKWQLDKNRFLVNVDTNKLIAFAPSFGVSYVQNELKEWYYKIINNIKYLSVREDRGKEIIKELTGREDVEVLVDPTMLLTPEEWDKVSKKPKQLKTDKYILNYFLGELSESRKNEINRIASENGCEVINILDKESPFYATGPSEFLYLEKHAFLICTDSFHSSIFAILYNRPFVVFDREDKEEKMNSRIDTLINKFNLKNRRYEGKITEENLNYDYTEAYEILKKEREKSERFLKKALNIEE